MKNSPQNVVLCLTHTHKLPVLEYLFRKKMAFELNLKK